MVIHTAEDVVEVTSRGVTQGEVLSKEPSLAVEIARETVKVSIDGGPIDVDPAAERLQFVQR